MTTAIVTQTHKPVVAGDILADFGKFLRLHVAGGDASPETLRTYHADAGQFVQWCGERGIDPATATEDDILIYRRALVAEYRPGTVAVKLQAIRRLYEAATWRGMRADNPAAGLRAPKDKTERVDKIKFLPLEGLRRLLEAPEGNGPAAIRDGAILSLMGRHGLRVSEVARPVFDDDGRKRSGLEVGDVDLEAGVIVATGKGRKTRKVYLTEASWVCREAWSAPIDNNRCPNSKSLFAPVCPFAPGRETELLRQCLQNWTWNLVCGIIVAQAKNSSIALIALVASLKGGSVKIHNRPPEAFRVGSRLSICWGELAKGRVKPLSKRGKA